MRILFHNYTKMIRLEKKDSALEKCNSGGSCQAYFIFLICGYSDGQNPLLRSLLSN